MALVFRRLQFSYSYTNKALSVLPITRLGHVRYSRKYKARFLTHKLRELDRGTALLNTSRSLPYPYFYELNGALLVRFRVDRDSPRLPTT